MINVGLLIIILINWDFSLTYLVLIFYLLFYIIISIGFFNILLLWKDKSSNIILNDINVEIIYNPVLYCIFILYIIAIAGFPIFILFFNKFYVNCVLAQNNGSSIVILLIIITLLAAN
jgi:NADH:ubiquinone oxidoreductase subunit 2 (subunit N)